MAAPAGPLLAAVRANEPAVARNWRRVVDMDFSPLHVLIYFFIVRRAVTCVNCYGRNAGGRSWQPLQVRFAPQRGQARLVSFCDDPLSVRRGAPGEVVTAVAPKGVRRARHE